MSLYRRKKIHTIFILLEDVDFHRLWSKNISDKTKMSIWKYLQGFCLIYVNLNSSHLVKFYFINCYSFYVARK